MRAGLYQRVSDDAGGRSRSVEQQNAEGRAVCEREAWNIAREYNEPDRSASRFATRARPVWEALRGDVRGRKLDVVVLWEPSRGSRDLEDWAGFLADCRRAHCGVYVVSHSRLYDLQNGRDWRSLAEDGVDSAYESEKMSVRIRRDRADLIARGDPAGRCPYGYTRIYDPVTRRPSQEPGGADYVVKEIITQIASGVAISDVQRWLWDNGIPSPTGQAHWHRRSITDVCHNVAYVGYQRDSAGELVPANWVPLVDESVFYRAAAVLAGNRRSGARPGKARWLCSYVISCRCGAPLAAQDRGKYGMWYRCSRQVAGCDAILMADLDRAVTRAVIAFVSLPHVYAEAIAPPDGPDVTGEVRAERDRLAELEEMVIAGKVSAASFSRIAIGIEARIAALESALPVPNPAMEQLVSRGAADVGLVWEGLTIASRRAVLRELVASPVFMSFAAAGGMMA